MTYDELVAFEEDIAASFNRGEIRSPVHLESGNEEELIKVFKAVKSEDWVFGSWRLHLKALLKGVSAEDLRAAIYRGESMCLRFDKERVYGSAIVGGTVSIAVGAALAIKRERRNEHVWCFMGDMTFCSGISYESMTYAANFDLPITWVVEDNGVSVCTDTREVWGLERRCLMRGKIRYYKYKSKWPHAGAGVRVQF